MDRVVPTIKEPLGVVHISTIAHTIWPLLADLTVGLRFATALSRFYPTVTQMIHLIRHTKARISA